MAKHNSNKRPRTQACFLDRDDVDNAILDYIHKHWPETEGLDIVDWNFKRGTVDVSFDLDTYENLGTVSARDHNEALIEIETLLDENEQLQSDIEELESDRVYLSGEVDELNEYVAQLESDEQDLIRDYDARIAKLEKRLERALNDLEDATDNGCSDGPRKPHHLF